MGEGKIFSIDSQRVLSVAIQYNNYGVLYQREIDRARCLTIRCIQNAPYGLDIIYMIMT
jgi:hypothetical protein